MAKLNHREGSIIARCKGCDGALSTFLWKVNSKELGAVTREIHSYGSRYSHVTYRLFQCGGCGMGALAIVEFDESGESYPGSNSKLFSFSPKAKEHLSLPKLVPTGIVTEFREVENCLENSCLRAAAGLFRSVLDKTLRANGYKTKRETLQQQIDVAASDGIITESRKRRAHEEVRVLGNDVLHDEWHEIPEKDVLAARHYCQRILEDFYDDRDSVLNLLREAGRIPDEDRQSDDE